MSKKRLLDLFCCAGGAGMGYRRAGFDVVGVDAKPQPRYPFEFIQADALEYVEKHGREFDAIHASPPCQGYSAMSNCRPGLSENYARLVDETRCGLTATGMPWVIENVVGAGLASSTDLFGNQGVMLCGQMFNLNLYRHRVFETSFPVIQLRHAKHLIPASKAGHWKPGTVISVCGNCAPIAVAREAMGIHWMLRDELSEAVPPAYTEYIGRQLIMALTPEPDARQEGGGEAGKRETQ